MDCVLTKVAIATLTIRLDSALVAHSVEDIRRITDAFVDASKKFGLKINIKNTEVFYLTNSSRTQEADIMVDEKVCLSPRIYISW